MRIDAEASEIWLATAAVSLPPSTRVRRLLIFSTLGSRGPSSKVSPLSGAISASKRPSAVAFSARVCDSMAKAYISSRLMSHFSAIISAQVNWLT